MDPSKVQELSAFYISLMANIKIRHNAISTVGQAMSGHVDSIGEEFTTRLWQEFGYLQLRKICELIAISVLAVHQDIEAAQSKRTRSHYHAEKIVKHLGKLHDFFPRPVTLTKMTYEGQYYPRIDYPPADLDYLTIDDFTKLYSQCGRILHSGSLESLASNNPVIVPAMDLARWKRKLSNLLRVHVIQLFDGKHVFLVEMNSSPNGKITCEYLDGPLPGPPAVHS